MNQGTSPRSVAILGAGIVGLASAWELVQQGLEVTVVDRAASGAGASRANGAQLSYSYVQPLADASLWRQLPKLLLSSDSPLTLRIQADPAQWAWGLQFLAACRGDVSRQTTQTLLALAARSRAGFDAMVAQTGLACDFAATGKLVLYSDAASFAGAQHQMLLQRALGSVQEAVDAAGCVAIEPALQAHAPRIAGAIHTPSECSADCYKVCEGLETMLRARGVRFLLNTEVTGLVTEGKRLRAAQSSAGAIEADAFVLAMATGSVPLARSLGIRLPVYPLKGYSVTVQAAQERHAAPKVSVTDAARKIVFARLGERLRIAGMAELVGNDTHIPEARIATLLAAGRAVFPQASDYAVLDRWAGLRPATPTGLPIVGTLPGAPANLLFNTGHGALGFTLAFGTAQALLKPLRATGRA